VHHFRCPRYNSDFFQSQEKNIQKVLVTTEDANDSSLNRHYFDRVITLDDLFDGKIEIK
jgi:hypothetical protein